MVEFALVAPMLVLLLVGIAEFGRAYNVQTTLSQAAREGVRVMVLQNDPAVARATTVSSALPLVVDPTKITVSPTNCISTTTSAATATVRVTYPVTFLTTLFGSGATLTLEGKGVMRCNG